jgi:SAM-dependent methyltransferase
MLANPNSTVIPADFEFAALREAYFYPRAIIEEFSPYLKGQVIEVGAGIGQMTALLAEQVGKENILGVEPDARFAKCFREQCPGIPLVEGTVVDLPPNTSCDVVVSINVMEHIQDHVEEMARYRALLAARNGYLCLFTPARPEIYAPIDKDFGHYRRYTKTSLRAALTAAGFRVRKLYYFNFPGYFAWLLNFRLLGSRSFNPRMIRLCDRLVFRLSHALEYHVMRPPLGQSVVAIAQA